MIPAHNAERYLRAAVDSALAQTYRPLEVVVVDDGSTDGTAALLEQYAGNDAVRTFRTDNRGPSAARNFGASRATGGFLAFLDADDAWLPERVARCIELLDRDAALGWVTTDLFVFDEAADAPDAPGGLTPTATSATSATRRWYRAGGMQFSQEQLDAIARANFCANGAVIRRDVFERAGGFDEELWRAEDYELWIRLILAGWRVGLVDEPLGWYRLRSDSLTADRGAEWESHLVVLERHLPELVARGARAGSVDAFAIARRLAARGDRQGAARFVMYAAHSPDLDRRARAAAWLAALRARSGARI